MLNNVNQNCIQMKNNCEAQNETAELKRYTEREKKELRELVSKIILGMGISPNIKGYKYMVEGIMQATMRPELKLSVTKGLYPAIAEKFNATPSQVERAMRHSLLLSYNKDKIMHVNTIIGVNIFERRSRPTPSEVIYIIAECIEIIKERGKYAI